MIIVYSPTLKNLPCVPVGNCKINKKQSATFFEFKIFHNESQGAFCMIEWEYTKKLMHSHSIMFEMQIYIMQNALWLSLWKILNSKKVALWFFILQFPTGTPGRFLRVGAEGPMDPFDIHWTCPVNIPTFKNLPGVPVGNCKMKNQSATFFEFEIIHIESQSAFCMI